MDERVSIIKGTKPVLLIAPHGANDINTAELTEAICNLYDAYAVINWGWKRSNYVDYFADEANCNNIEHLMEDVVEDEFLVPIKRYVNYILKNHSDAFIFIIHGIGNDIRKKTKDPNLDIVLGYGRGVPPKYTCDISMKNAFLKYLGEGGFKAYVGKKNGQFSGRARTNLNQFYTHKDWQPNNYVHSMQVEIVYELRKNENLTLTASRLALAIQNTMQWKVGEFSSKIKAPAC